MYLLQVLVAEHEREADLAAAGDQSRGAGERLLGSARARDGQVGRGIDRVQADVSVVQARVDQAVGEVAGRQAERVGLQAAPRHVVGGGAAKEGLEVGRERGLAAGEDDGFDPARGGGVDGLLELGEARAASLSVDEAERAVLVAGQDDADLGLVARPVPSRRHAAAVEHNGLGGELRAQGGRQRPEDRYRPRPERGGVGEILAEAALVQRAAAAGVRFGVAGSPPGRDHGGDGGAVLA